MHALFWSSLHGYPDAEQTPSIAHRLWSPTNTSMSSYNDDITRGGVSNAQILALQREETCPCLPSMSNVHGSLCIVNSLPLVEVCDDLQEILLYACIPRFMKFM
jgi:hypothetical protein